MAGGLFNKLFGSGGSGDEGVPNDPGLGGAAPDASAPIDAPVSREQAAEVIASSPFAHHAKLLEPMLRSAVGLDPVPTSMDQLPLGASRFAGSPDLPPGFEWPMMDDAPQTFLAQINLADTAALDDSGLLPKSGWLYFFYEVEEGPWGFDPNDKKGFTVHYHEGDVDSLVRTEQPGDISPTAGEFNCCRVDVRSGWTMPDPSDDRFKPLPVDRHDDLEFDQYAEMLEQITGFNIDGDKNHHMLGYPQIIQGDMRIDCQLVTNGIYCGDASGYRDPRVESLKEGVNDWRLLMQIDTDEGRPGWMWGDCGRIYFWIRESDLREKNFDATWFILQCC